MDLFIVNRHNDIEETDTTPQKSAEQAKLEYVIKRIELNRTRRERQREKEKRKHEDIAQQKIKRQQKRETREYNMQLEEFQIETQPTDQQTDEKIIETENFTILGHDHKEKYQQKKVQTHLPKWLTNPIIISNNLQELDVKVKNFKILDKSLRNALKSQNIKYLFPVQAIVIPYILKQKQHVAMQPNDLCIATPTGSGKTLTYLLPIVQSLKHYQIKEIRAIIVVPTQNLAIQIMKLFQLFIIGTKLNLCLLIGKQIFLIEQNLIRKKSNVFGWLKKCDIIICTPGRLIDHLIYTEGLNLRYLEFLVIDETDRILDNLQNDWLYHLEKFLDNKGSRGTGIGPPQKLLFSATLTQDPEKLQQLNLFQPKLFTTNSQTNTEKFILPKELIESYLICDKQIKPLLIYYLIKSKKIEKNILIFTHSIESTHRLNLLLNLLFKNEMKIEEISSKLNLLERNQLIDRFKNGLIDVLICTDSLARGIDLPNVNCVLSYSIPKYLRTYIHRAGRTARAGSNGTFLTILDDSKQLQQFQLLLKPLNRLEQLNCVEIDEESMEELGGLYAAALEELKLMMDKEKINELDKIRNTKRIGKKIKKKKGKQIKKSVT